MSFLVVFCSTVWFHMQVRWQKYGARGWGVDIVSNQTLSSVSLYDLTEWPEPV